MCGVRMKPASSSTRRTPFAPPKPNMGAMRWQTVATWSRFFSASTCVVTAGDSRPTSAAVLSPPPPSPTIGAVPQTMKWQSLAEAVALESWSLRLVVHTVKPTSRVTNWHASATCSFTNSRKKSSMYACTKGIKRNKNGAHAMAASTETK